MKVDTESRFAMEDVRRHPWFTRQNKYLSSDGRLQDPINLATSMFESLRIDFTQDPLAPSEHRYARQTSAMDVDMDDIVEARLASTQPEMPVGDVVLDWEAPRLTRNGFSSTQPQSQSHGSVADQFIIAERLEDEPSFSQFSQNPAVPLSRTQKAQKFHDIVPARSLTRFFSTWAVKLLIPLVCEALHRLGVHVPTIPPTMDVYDPLVIRVAAKDQRKCLLQGSIIVEYVSEGLLEVEFTKTKGDPLEWRRFFKKITILCKDAVYKPDE